MALSVDAAGDWHMDLKSKLELCKEMLDTGVQAMLFDFVAKVCNLTALLAVETCPLFLGSVGAKAALDVWLTIY